MWEILKHSIYSQEREEGFYQTSCLDTHQLGQLKLKNIQEKSCYQGKLTGSYLNSLFGMISTRSESTTPTAQNISKGLNQSEMNLSSQADFLALTSVQQEKEQESRESTQDSGRKWQEWFAKYDQDSSSWKTPQGSLLGDLESFSETWPKSGMMQNGKCSEQTMSVLPTEGRGSGSWPTPNVCGNYNRKGASETSGDGLATAVNIWPTPTSCMNKGTSEKAMYRANGNSRENDRIDHKVAFVDGNFGGQLNPDWVEWLMLWPVGWTSLSPITMDWRDWTKDPADTGEIPRVGFNIDNRAKRLKAIGNGQVPLVATTAFLELSEGLL